MTDEHKHKVTKTLELPDGSSVTVTITSSDPIDEADYLMLRPTAMQEMADTLTSLGNAMRPLGTPEL